MKILHVCESIKLSDGGIPKSVLRLSKELSKINCDVSILTSKAGSDYTKNNFTKLHMTSYPQTMSELILSTFLKKNKILEHTQFRPDIIHIHGVWPPINISVLKSVNHLSIPMIISPHASFLPGDLNNSLYKQIKKWLGWKLLFSDLIANCGSFHVTSFNELESIQSLNYQTEVAIIPNGVDFEEFANLPPDSLFRTKYPKTIGKKIILFMSRINPTKGLGLLAHAWGSIAKRHNEWHLVIAGQDQNAYWKKIKNILDSYNLTNQYTYTGFLDGAMRLSAYNAADLFVLPSFRENFGFVITEALMAHTPVITTIETPWEELPKYDCGWIIEPEKEALANILKNALLLSDFQLKTMGENGSAFIKRSYSWKIVAQQMKAFYRWILEDKERPSFVTQIEGMRKAKLHFGKSQRLL